MIKHFYKITLSFLIVLSGVLAVTVTPLTTRASPPDAAPVRSEHERLSEELIRRWSETKILDFLENKKSMIDEVMELGLRMDLQVLKDTLASDLETVLQKNSELVDWTVFSSLQHQTQRKYLIENLRRGYLEPRENPKTYSRYGVYLELHRKAWPRPFDWGDVELHFATLLLDRTDYHINPNWSYGNYNPDSASPAVNQGRTNYYVRKLLAECEKNEFVFHERVPLSALVRIVVPTGQKKSLIHELQKNKISRPDSRTWDELIAEQNKSNYLLPFAR